MRVSVIGLGKLGSPMAACFAAKGLTTIGVDLDEAFVNAVNEGRAPVYEPDLTEMMAEGRASLSATTDTVAAVLETDVTFVIVPTPSDEDGGFSLSHVLAACESIGEAIGRKDSYHLVALTSTVMPGATGGPVRAALEETSGRRAGPDFGLCYSPEFIALGSVIRDFLNPDFLLVGESDARAGQMLADLYGRVVANDPPVARLGFVNAEIAKLSVNTFVTTKIAFANMLARICERLPGGDVDEVTSAIGLDSRIGAKYLRGAISYGGPCFPRDNIALSSLARSLGVPAHVAEATDTANREGITQLAQLVIERLPERGTVGVLGLSYKPNTDVVVESAGLQLASTLADAGISVIAYDPVAMPNAERTLGGMGVRFARSVEELMRECDVAVIATPWEQFATLAGNGLPEQNQDSPLVIDCWRMFSAEQPGDGIARVRLGVELASTELSSAR